jgi:trimethylamine--corrinoid protein Co-methyltransferase
MIGGNTVYFCSFPGKNIVDLDTWEPRLATLEENNDGVRVLDALENLHFLTPYTPYFEIEGVPSVMAIPQSVASKIKHSTKLQFTGHQQDCEIFTIRMAQAVGMDIQGICNPAPPLTYPADDVNSAFRFLEAGFSLHIAAGGVMGGTAPATIAGSLVTSNAEIIGGVVLAQLIRPGARIIVCDFVLPQDMRTGYPAFGAIEGALHGAIFNQIWRKYEIPVQTV